jgi:hypothetical protein
MNRRITVALVGIAALGTTLALAQDRQPEAPPMPELPPGWTEADAMACVIAGTPGEMHAFLAEGVGVWAGKSKMWMAPGAEPITSECTSTVTSVMDGRFIKIEVDGEMPGMGRFSGFGINGYDNVAETFQSMWIDNHSTGIMVGTGELSPDRKTLTWNYNYTCPINKKPAVMREVNRFAGENAMTLEMYGNDPKSGKEFKMMEIAFTRKSEPGALGDARKN